MLRRLLVVGLLAGLVAGLAMAALQHVTTVPLIIAAEVYEAAPHEHAPGVTAEPHHDGHDHAPAWSPSGGLERTLSTTVATVISAIGFSLVLLAALLLDGRPITPARALAFAAGAFAATGLATGLGLAPELPGSAAADLQARQLWWIATAIGTAGGIWLIARAPAPIKAAGLALIIAPHVIGAPEAPGYASTAPAELAAHFASTSLAVHGALWAMIGLAVGQIWPRTERLGS